MTRRRPAIDQARRWASFAEHYPDRAAVIESTRASMRAGDLVAEMCEQHGAMTPTYDWIAMVHVGWRCYPCHRSEQPVVAVESTQAHDEGGPVWRS